MAQNQSSGSRLLLVVNPKSGRMKMKNYLLQVVSIFCDAGYSVSVYTTKDRLDATQFTEKNAKNYDLIVCCGGDGT